MSRNRRRLLEGAGLSANGCSPGAKSVRTQKKKEYYATDTDYRARHSARNAQAAKRRHDSGDLRFLAQRLLWEAKSRAKRSGVLFALTLDDVLPALHRGVCPVFGTRFTTRSRGSKAASDTSPSLDQLIPGAGYTPENVRVISWRANVLKHNASPEELMTVARWMANELR